MSQEFFVTVIERLGQKYLIKACSVTSVKQNT